MTAETKHQLQNAHIFLLVTHYLRNALNWMSMREIRLIIGQIQITSFFTKYIRVKSQYYHAFKTSEICKNLFRNTAVWLKSDTYKL